MENRRKDKDRRKVVCWIIAEGSKEKRKINGERRIQHQPLKRRAKIYYQKTADGLNQIVRLEGFLSISEIEEISPEVHRLWGQQKNQMYKLFNKHNITVRLWPENSLFSVGQIFDDEQFNKIIIEMKKCGKELSCIIKAVEAAQENEVKVIEI